jgi:pyrroline-5-carboxylate reductase
MSEITVGVIGAGNMGSAIARGIARGGNPVLVYDLDPGKTSSLEGEGIQALTGSPECARQSSILILAVKPAGIADLLEEIRSELQDTVVVSVAAGLPIASLEAVLGKGAPIVRVMPNTPALVGSGMSVLSANEKVSPEEMSSVESLFSYLGETARVPESLMDAVTGVSGSGPAYGYTFIQALADGGVRMGLPRETARKLAAQALLGAARMVLETGKNPIELRDQVTSPGGTTIEAVQVLEENGWSGTVMEAVEAATLKSKELGRK